ncbi:hypothetical protein CUMW_155040 [Citrus unshiu]|uniref:Uncharacterized protein n=1 Tax=Citrus unshiu TaxID=55188 RepID=A0A2H5PPF9_CITUN|nr:hypothetical protein CUMW_155040 [Citrus unshiu]
MSTGIVFLSLKAYSIRLLRKIMMKNTSSKLSLFPDRLGSSQNFSDLLQPMQLHYLFSLLPCQELKIGKFMHL